MNAAENAVQSVKTERPGSDYKRHDPKGWCGDPRRGAALGRGAYHADDPSGWTGKLYVSRIPLDNGGYDRNGTYFGWGDPLWWVRDAESDIDFVIREPNRASALYRVALQYRKASFVRGLSEEQCRYLMRVKNVSLPNLRSA